MTENVGYGQAAPWDFADEFSQLRFVIRQFMAQMRTMVPVKVMAVHGGGVDVPPLIDVLPLINELDGNSNPVKHGTVYGVSCLRIQGGPCAIILDPAVGDIGYVQVSDRDMSAVIGAPGQQVNPGSYRQYDLADGVYVGGILNKTPTCYIQLKSDGTLSVTDQNGNKIVTSSTGMTLSDINGNQIQMKLGAVNIVTGALQVNGVPVTVP